MYKLLLFGFLFSALQLVAQPVIGVELRANGFDEPVDITHAGDDRLFIVERAGIIKILYPDNSVATFLDLQAIVGSTAGEQGLLGLTFHPEYASNGYFYVNYTDLLGDTHISRFSVNEENSESADASTELNLIYMDQPAANHNGGDLNFGPDGYLYIFMGDGGGAGHNRSQQIVGNKFGKILRLDVDGGTPYAIPPNNPFVGIPGDDEIWAIGLRNPWRCNFDRLTGDLFIADVGADSWEEINVIKADTSEFFNFGWKCYEGNMLRAGTLCDTIDFDFDFPAFEYTHDFETGGFAVTGGFVYRGTEFPNLYGKYIFCDYISGNFWTLEQNETGEWEPEFHDYVIDHISSFGEDVNGEIYACINQTGEIYKIVDLCQNLVLDFNVTDAAASTINNGAINLTVSGGESPYAFLWNTGAVTEDISSLFAGIYSVDVTDQTGCLKSAEVTVNNACGPATEIMSTTSTTSVFIDWDDVGANGYRVMYKPSGPGPFMQMNTPISQINIAGLSPSTAYVFKIKNKCPGAPGIFSADGNFITNSLKEIETTENESKSETISIYPNPTINSFTLLCEGSFQETEILVFNVLGEIIPISIEVFEFENKFIIYLPEISKQPCIIKIKRGDIISGKILIAGH